MLTGALNTKAVWWSLVSKDGYGKATYSTAQEISVRWQDSQKMFVNDLGKQEVSKSVIYTDLSIGKDDYLYLGLLSGLSTAQKADPLLVNMAYPVRNVGKSYDLSGTVCIIKVML